MTSKVTAIIYTLLILCKDLRTEPIAVPGPSSGIMLQDTPGFILANKRILTQKIYLSLDPQLQIERMINASGIQSPEIKTWYQGHIIHSQRRITQILEQIQRTLVNDPFPRNQRPKRFISAIAAAVIFTIVGVITCTIATAANFMSIKALEHQILSLRDNLGIIHEEMKRQRERLTDLLVVMNDTIVTTNLHSELFIHSTNLHESHVQFKQELMFTKESIDAHTQVYHDEVQSGMNDLREGRLPLYFVSDKVIRQMLQKVNENKVEKIQLNLAVNMGAATLLYIDPVKMEICFLIAVPFVTDSTIFQMKKVHNVGTWKDNVHVKIQTPDIVAYQPWRADWLSVPILDNCVRFRDNNFQCEGDPFNYDTTNALCGIDYEAHGSEKCHVTMSKAEDNAVNLILIKDKWLVSTRLPNMTIFYKDQVMIKVLALPSAVSIIKVPPNSRITIGDRTLYPVETLETEGEVESIDAFQNQDIVIPPDLKFLLDHKSSHTVRMIIRKDSIAVEDFQYSPFDEALMYPPIWSGGSDYAWGILILFNLLWLIGLTIKLVRGLRFIRKNMTKLWIEHYRQDPDSPIRSEWV